MAFYPRANNHISPRETGLKNMYFFHSYPTLDYNKLFHMKLNDILFIIFDTNFFCCFQTS